MLDPLVAHSKASRMPQEACNRLKVVGDGFWVERAAGGVAGVPNPARATTLEECRSA